MDKKVKEGLIVFGGGLLLFYFVKPLFFPSKTPVVGYTPISQKQKDDARTSIKAYKAAKAAGEPTSQLAELNNLIHNQTGLRVNMKIDGTYFAVTDEGQAINV